MVIHITANIFTAPQSIIWTKLHNVLPVPANCWAFDIKIDLMNEGEHRQTNRNTKQFGKNTMSVVEWSSVFHNLTA